MTEAEEPAYRPLGRARTQAEPVGKPLAASAFIQDQTDVELVAFIKVGRPAGDPENTTGIDMAPKGGNPSLDDEDLANIVAYLRTLQ